MGSAHERFINGLMAEYVFTVSECPTRVPSPEFSAKHSSSIPYITA
jgi:hypothetical protein